MIAKEKLIQILKEKGISKVELANRLNTLPQRIQIMLSENSNPTEKTLVAIVKALGISMGDLYDDPGLNRPEINVAIDGVNHVVRKNISIRHIFVIDKKEYPVENTFSIRNTIRIGSKEHYIDKDVTVQNVITIDGKDYPVENEFEIQILDEENPE